VKHAAPVSDVLLVERKIQPVLVPQSADIRGRGAVPQHLQDRIPRHQMDEKKNEGNDQPDDGKSQK
jgi:hypothetical protein